MPSALRKSLQVVRLGRLLGVEKRAPGLAKWLPAIAVGYAILPFDILPDVVPLIGQVDDAVRLLAAGGSLLKNMRTRKTA